MDHVAGAGRFRNDRLWFRPARGDARESLGLIASRWESLPGRAAALGCWLRSLDARFGRASWSAGVGSAAAPVLIALSESRVSAERIPGVSRLCHRAAERSDDPEGDRHVLSTGYRAVVLWLRPRGTTIERLAEGLRRAYHPLRLVLPADDRLVPSKVRRRLIDLGAVERPIAGQSLADELAATAANVLAIERLRNVSTSIDTRPLDPHAAIIEAVDFASPSFDRDWLVHRTRPTDRRRPAESRIAFFRRLLDARSDELDGGIGALRSMLRQGRLFASAGPIRGDRPMICWSRPAALSMQAPVFRPARRQWDESRYGVAVRRSLLERLGARPVIYGDASLGRHLDPESRPWFQPAVTTRRDGTRIDWRLEREWRSPGDLRLDDCGRDELMLFVPTRSEAESLRARSPWPIGVLRA